MFVTNRKSVDVQILHRIAGAATRTTVRGNSTVNISAISSVSQIVFQPWERKAREINQRLNGSPSVEPADRNQRFIDTEIDYRLISSGTTV